MKDYAAIAFAVLVASLVATCSMYYAQKSDRAVSQYQRTYSM